MVSDWVCVFLSFCDLLIVLCGLNKDCIFWILPLRVRTQSPASHHPYDARAHHRRRAQACCDERARHEDWAKHRPGAWAPRWVWPGVWVGNIISYREMLIEVEEMEEDPTHIATTEGELKLTSAAFCILWLFWRGSLLVLSVSSSMSPVFWLVPTSSKSPAFPLVPSS